MPVRPRPGRATATAAGIAWYKCAVRAILTNPRYTGHQVWNKQRKDEVLLDVDDVALGHITKLRWNEAGKWIWSETDRAPADHLPARPSTQAQAVLAGRADRHAEHKPHRAQPPIRVAWLLLCGVCERRMQSHWVNVPPITGAGSPPSTRWPTASSTRAMCTCARTRSSAT